MRTLRFTFTIRIHLLPIDILEALFTLGGNFENSSCILGALYRDK